MAQETESSRLDNLVCGRETLGRNARGFFVERRVAHNVRYWHKAGIKFCTAHVRFRG